MLGALAGSSPILAFTAVAGVGYILLTMVNVTLGVCLFTVIAFIDLLPVPLGPVVSFTKIAGFILAFAWLVTSRYGKSAGRGLLDEQPAAVVLLVAFLAWTTASSAWALSPGTALGGTYRYGLNALLFVIVCGVLRRRRDVVWVIGAFVAGAAISAVYGLAVPPASPGSAGPARVAGTLGDPNEFAALLVAALPLAIALAAGRGWSVWLRALGAATAAMSVAGIFLSVSRGGLVALVVVLAAGLVLAGRWRAKLLLIVSLVILAGAGYLLSNPVALQRVTASNDGTGRTDLWTVGLRIVADRPVLGVGAENFSNATIRYLLRPGLLPRSDLIDSTPKAAHNMYLEVLADLGLVGALLFVSLIALALACGVRAARFFAQQRDGPMEMLTRAWLIGITGLLTADAFLSAEFDKLLWLLLALGPALLAVARGSSRRSHRPDHRREARLPALRRAHPRPSAHPLGRDTEGRKQAVPA